ncbi:hypothetical protein QR680_009565 [Steinernema hermaphroditum]|uniref:Craniofacial development protein 1 n=1 Tax=Steinernema hermaphroditum TaxID=289476 RepID=A0AA39IMK1_9BILA|nr:hypothetical protein QR680_009565 [Steinernema hermaphroditum]
MSFNLEDHDYASEDDEEYVPCEGGDDEEEDLDEEDDVDEEDTGVKEKNLQEIPKEKASDERVLQKEQDRIDQLWADFCTDTDTPTTSVAKTNTSSVSPTPVSTKPAQAPEDKVAKQLLEEIFDFAGEEVRRTVHVAEEKPSSTPDENHKEHGSKKTGTKRAAGLTGALSSLKKKKISVLDKSDHDWNQFKEEKGISEELETHNKGKGGYIGRMEFLTRADYQQFEREKEARKIARKN